MAALNQWIAGDAELPDQPDLDPDDPDDLSGPPAATVEPLDLVRFRPNVVVDGDELFAEASWQGVRMGGIDYRTTMICDRCVMTTYDPQTLPAARSRSGRSPGIGAGTARPGSARASYH